MEHLLQPRARVSKGGRMGESTTSSLFLGILRVEKGQDGFADIGAFGGKEHILLIDVAAELIEIHLLRDWEIPRSDPRSPDRSPAAWRPPDRVPDLLEQRSIVVF